VVGVGLCNYCLVKYFIASVSGEDSLNRLDYDS
jgi:hypothetical protein